MATRTDGLKKQVKINKNNSFIDNILGKLSAELETSKIGSTSHQNQADLIKPIIYSKVNETGRNKLSADFVVHSPPESQFKPLIRSKEIIHEIGIMVTDSIYYCGCLIEETQFMCKGKIGASHYLYTSL